MTKDDEPPDRVECCICGKKINIAARRKVKKINGSGRIFISKARQLHDGRWFCSDACFNLGNSAF